MLENSLGEAFITNELFHNWGTEEEHQGQGIASELVNYAKKMSDERSIPLLFDTDMKAYAEMYQHFGCELYNTITADNGVTRYSLCYKK